MKPQLTTFKKDIVKGMRLTVLSISDFMATTCKSEVEITRIIEGRIVFKQRGKRKEFYLSTDKELIVFEGWDKVKIDTDGRSFFGSATFNIVHDTVDSLRTLIEEECICELSEIIKSRIMLMSRNDFAIGNLDNMQPVFLETETDSAVVLRRREQHSTLMANSERIM